MHRQGAGECPRKGVGGDWSTLLRAIASASLCLLHCISSVTLFFHRPRLLTGRKRTGERAMEEKSKAWEDPQPPPHLL